MVPEAGAPEPPAVPREATLGGAPQADSSSADHLDASSAPGADPCAERLGRFRVDFEALRKRKEALGGNDRPCRLLKRRKYFAKDEEVFFFLCSFTLLSLRLIVALSAPALRNSPSQPGSHSPSFAFSAGSGLAELERHPCCQTGWWSGPFHRAPRACTPAVLSS